MNTIEQTQIVSIWRNINISTLIFLKLFDNIVNDDRAKSSRTHHLYQMQNIAYEYGLLKAYLDKSHRFVHLLFHAETALSDLNLTSSAYYSFSDRLIDCEQFHSVENRNGILRIVLKIDDKFISDIEHIIVSSNYSGTSPVFKQAMQLPDTINVVSHPIGNYIIQKNIPKAIVEKSSIFRKKLESAFRSNGIDGELFIRFNPDKEYWDESHYSKYM